MLAPDVVRAQQGPFLYVPNAGDNNLSVIDTPTNATVSATILVGSAPFAAGVRGDQALVYATNINSNNVSVIDTTTNSVVATVGVGVNPFVAAVSPNGAFVYVSNNGAGSVSVINAATNTVSATVAVGAAPAGLAITSDGARVYVANFSSNTVSVIDTATNTVIDAPIPVGNSPTGMAIAPDGSRAYVTNTNSNSISVINTATNTVIGAPIPVGANPDAVAVSPNGTRVYVTNFNSNTVSVIDAATNTVVTTIPVGSGPEGVAFSPDGTRAYVANSNNNTVSVINTTTNSIIDTVAVGSAPIFPGICSNGNALLAAGLTFTARTSGALACTLASGAAGSPGPVFTGGTLQFAGANISSALPITLQAAGGTFDTNDNNATLSGTISGPGSLTKIGLGTLTLAGSSAYTGATNVNAGTLQAGATNAFSPFSAFTVASGATLDLNSFNQTIGSLAGAGSVTLGAATLTTGNDNTNTTFSGVISGSGGLTKVGIGALVLSGNNTYSGPTTLNASMLTVNGSIANSATTVNAGTFTVNGSAGAITMNAGTTIVNGSAGATTVNAGTLGGTGTLGNTIINGGTLSPGNSIGTITVNGNLVLSTAASYLVEVSPTAADRTNVTGTATLAGTVSALFASGTYMTRSYTILSAAGGRSSTFSSLTTSNLPAGFTASLSYTATDAILNLTATLGALATGGLSGNQANVANALNAFFNNGGALPPAFVSIFGLTGANLANALTLLSGEAATGGQQGAFQLTNQFLGIMLDPFVDGRSDPLGGGAIGFAPEREELPEEIALAYSKVLKAPPKPVAFEQRWSVWGAGYGGSNRTTGDPAVVGSHDLSARTAGGAAGLDYRLAPGTVVGFALAGGGTSWGLAQGLGGGKSDAFQAGIYGATRWGPAYLAAALSFTNHWMSIPAASWAGASTGCCCSTPRPRSRYARA